MGTNWSEDKVRVVTIATDGDVRSRLLRWCKYHQEMHAGGVFWVAMRMDTMRILICSNSWRGASGNLIFHEKDALKLKEKFEKKHTGVEVRIFELCHPDCFAKFEIRKGLR